MTALSSTRIMCIWSWLFPPWDGAFTYVPLHSRVQAPHHTSPQFSLTDESVSPESVNAFWKETKTDKMLTKKILHNRKKKNVSLCKDKACGKANFKSHWTHTGHWLYRNVLRKLEFRTKHRFSGGSRYRRLGRGWWWNSAGLEFKSLAPT